MKIERLFKEWLKQSSYDLDTAKVMFEAKRYVYCVFMCHLAVEKAFKAYYNKQLKAVPPKTHDLIYLCEKIKVNLPEEMLDFVDKLNNLSVPVRYPDDLGKLLKQYSRLRAQEILVLSGELLLWLKKNKE